MEKKSNSMGPVIIAVIVTAVVVGGGMYYFQKNALRGEQGSVKNLEVNVPTSDKSLVEYYKSRQDSSSSLKGKPSALGFQEVGKVKIACPKDADGPCGGDLLIVSKSAVQSGSQEFYLAQEGGAGYDYFGPFNDNLTRLVNESKTTDSILESF